MNEGEQARLRTREVRERRKGEELNQGEQARLGVSCLSLHPRCQARRILENHDDYFTEVGVHSFQSNPSNELNNE